MTSNPRVPRPGPPQPSVPLRERLQAKLFDAPDRPAQAPAHAPTPQIRSSSPSTVAASAAARTPISISELTDRMGRHLAINFSGVCVMGEVSEVRAATNGHAYFKLKDAGATIDAMVWADRLEGLAVRPKQGMRVVAVVLSSRRKWSAMRRG